MNALKNRPSVGDIIVILNGEKKFVSGSDCTKSFIDSQDCIGVVYNVQGNLVRYVGGKNNQGKKWSCVADYEITKIPSADASCTVTLVGQNVGTFSYKKSTGTIEEFATQLNTWLKASDNATAKKFEAYTRNGHSYLQMSTYDTYESTVSISGCTLSKLIGTELAQYDITWSLNQYGYQSPYNGMCRDRLGVWERTSGISDGNTNPTTVIDPSVRLFQTFPCSPKYFDSSLGVKLQAEFKSYDDYLDACMLRERELDKGVMKYRDGKYYTSLLTDKTVLINGVETKAYTAANWANDYDSGVEGYGSGTFWLPSMYELALLMMDIKNDMSDPVNVALAKNSDWSQINPGSPRWCSLRCGGHSAWYFNRSGFTYPWDCFYHSFTVSVVSAFEI